MAKTEIIILAREQVEVQHNGTPHKVWRVEYEATDGNQGTAVARTVPGGDGPHMVELKETQFGEFTEAITFPGLEEQQRASTKALTRSAGSEKSDVVDELTADKLRNAGIVPKEATAADIEAMLNISRALGLSPLYKEVEFFVKSGKVNILVKSTGWAKVRRNDPNFIMYETKYNGLTLTEFGEKYGHDEIPKVVTNEMSFFKHGRVFVRSQEIRLEEWRGLNPNSPVWRGLPTHMSQLRAASVATRDHYGFMGATIDEFDAAILEAEDIGYTDISGLLSASTAQEVSAWVQANPAAAKANRAEVAKKRKEVRG